MPELKETRMDFSAVKENFQTSLKSSLPLSSNTEQHVVLDEYHIHLAQFSIAINRLTSSIACDENVVQVVKLLAGMYTLLKTTFLSPENYNELFMGVGRIEASAAQFIRHWATQQSAQRQKELFDLGWWVEGAACRAHLVVFLYFCLPSLKDDDGEALKLASSLLRSINHPIKGALLARKLHSQLLKDDLKMTGAVRNAAMAISIECFSWELKLLAKWSEMLGRQPNSHHLQESLYNLTLAVYFQEAALIFVLQDFEASLLPTALVEIVNCGHGLIQFLIFKSIVKAFDSAYILPTMGQLLRSSSQFAQGVDLKSLMSELFEKIIQTPPDGARINSTEFFESVWNEISQLIKNRSEIDQKDTVLIAASVISITRQILVAAEDQIMAIDEILEFLEKILVGLCPTGFSENSSVGKALISLIATIFQEFEDDSVVLKLKSLASLLNGCLQSKAARKCSLGFLRSLQTSSALKSNLSEAINLFRCFTRADLMILLQDDCEATEEVVDSDALVQIERDLDEFSSLLVEVIPLEMLYSALDSSSTTLNLFLFPKMIEKILASETLTAAEHDSELILIKRILNSCLGNTSTALQTFVSAPRVTPTAALWIRPEYPKMLAVKLNLMVAQGSSKVKAAEAFDFYAEVLTIMNQNVSMDVLKIEIIDSILESLSDCSDAASKPRLNQSDYDTLMEHLAKQAGQLLRKSDRCTLLLKLLPSIKDSRQLRRSSEQLITWLPEVVDPESRNQLSLQFLEIALSLGIAAGLDETFNWLRNQKGWEMRLYPLRVEYDELKRLGEVNVPEVQVSDGGVADPNRASEPHGSTTAEALYPASTKSDAGDEEDLRKLAAFQSLNTGGDEFI